MVIYRGADGKPGYHQTDDIHDAVGFVEQMRNHEGVEHARIFRLEEVVFQYRPYYRVELADSAAPTADGANGARATEALVNGRSNERNVVLPPIGGEDGTQYDGAEAQAEGAIDVIDAEPAEVSLSGEKKGLFGR